MKQRFHTIIKPEPTGWFVGWVEEVPGAISQGRSLAECRQNLRESLQLVLDTYRDEARLCLDGSCIEEVIELDVGAEDAAAAPHGEMVSGVGDDAAAADGPRQRRRGPAPGVVPGGAHAGAASTGMPTGMLQPMA